MEELSFKKKDGEKSWLPTCVTPKNYSCSPFKNESSDTSHRLWGFLVEDILSFLRKLKNDVKNFMKKHGIQFLLYGKTTPRETLHAGLNCTSPTLGGS